MRRARRPKSSSPLSAVLAAGSRDAVATVGICDVFPSAINSIPSRVRLTLDARDIDLARRDGVLQSVRDQAQLVSAARGVSVEFEVVNADPPAACSSGVIEALVQACEKHSLKFQTIVSRAYHDSLFMSRIAPTGMLFIPCRNGYSHRPDEFASLEDIVRGTHVLAGTLSILSR